MSQDQTAGHCKLCIYAIKSISLMLFLSAGKIPSPQTLLGC